MGDHERIELRVSTGVRLIGTHEDLLAEARKRAPDPSVFDERTPAFWTTEISSNRLDFYRTRMMESTLRNFAADAERGVSFQSDHKTHLFLGQSLRGVYETLPGKADGGADLQRTVASFFTLRDMQLNPHVGTSDFVDAVRAGVRKDVSVGFWSDDIRCSVCGGRMVDSWFWGLFGIECDHIPGEMYPEQDANGDPIIGPDGSARMVECWGEIHDGHLLEVSDVYDGATPEAGYIGFLKAQAMAERGLLDPKMVRGIELRYRRSLPALPTIHAVPGGPNAARTAGQGGTMAGKAKRDTENPEAEEAQVDETEIEETTADDAEELDEETTFDEVEESDDEAGDGADAADDAGEARMAVLRARFAPHGIKLGRDPIRAVEALAQRLVDQEATVAAGKRYADDLIEEAVKFGVRALGARGFKENVYRPMLQRLADAGDFDAIKTIRDDWRKDGDARLSDANGDLGGRKSRNKDDPKEPATPRRRESVEAYQVR